ncbi:MAG: type IV-A pilus assembly ATPase PilB [Nitrospirae bacterium]|nr:type IV-A pilus assembly ATPase PilB [Candidatus Troglogloeales bacterium]MBI3597997.1 type IV-A pilus assembly ATPase PilB [Candidatus Troglogloeales bacterium]
MAESVGRLLVSAKLLTEEQLQNALLAQKKEGGRFGKILIQMGLIDEVQIAKFFSQHWGVPSVDLNKIEIDNLVVKLIPSEMVRKHLVLPIKRLGTTISLAMIDPTDVFAIEDIKFITGYNVEPIIATESALIEKIEKHYGRGPTALVEKGPAGSSALIEKNGQKWHSALVEKKSSMEVTPKGPVREILPAKSDDAEETDELPMHSIEDLDLVVGDALDAISVVEEQKEESGLGVVEAPIVKLVNGLLVNAIKIGASDVHVEPFETLFRVRFRVDGVLKTVMNLPIKIKNAVVSRLKIMSHLDIAERRLPQDGRIKLKFGKTREIDFRVSTLPCLFGEKVVLRILDKSSLSLDLTKLGFEVNALKEFTEAINAPYGMVLVTGPTGSGKTTTLYSALSTINTQEVNIMTAEDPVEYNLLGINQVQMKEEIGLNFASALRSFLRQDPDIIMVGEIRDYETAEIGVKAALTGHLVLSTLHTNDAPSTINRLLNMGIEPFLVASSVVMIIAQRLTRKICVNCKEKVEVPPDALLRAGFTEEELSGIVVHKGKGCEVCNQTGYKGRVALYEVMPIRQELRELILQGASSDELKRESVNHGMKTLRMSGLQKIKEGMTTLEEVLETTFLA